MPSGLAVGFGPGQQRRNKTQQHLRQERHQHVEASAAAPSLISGAAAAVAVDYEAARLTAPGMDLGLVAGAIWAALLTSTARNQMGISEHLRIDFIIETNTCCP